MKTYGNYGQSKPPYLTPLERVSLEVNHLIRSAEKDVTNHPSMALFDGRLNALREVQAILDRVRQED